MNIRDLMRRSAMFHANKPAIIAGDIRLTFKEAWERGTRMANLMLSMGLKPGDKVASLEDNTIEAVDFFLGAAIANIVRVPLYARNTRKSHQHMMKHTGCKAVVVDDHYADQLEGMNHDIECLEHIIVRTKEGYEEWLASFSVEDPNVEVAEDGSDLYVIRHTGGTTGNPKGVSFTHDAWLGIGRNWFFTMPPVEVGDVCMHLAPISHASGYQFVPIWLQGGVNLVVQKYQPDVCVDLMVEEKVGYVFMAPTMVQDVMQVEGAAEKDWSNLKVILIGAAPITEANVKKAYEFFGDAMCQLYGQTEAVPATVTMAKDWVRDDIPGSKPMRSLGKIHPFCGIQIRDPDTNELMPIGEEGEICMQVAGQMTGYWENPESTAKTLIDGWVHTSDMGYIDKNGYLYMLDRKDDMIISGGYNIWPTELENAIASIPEIIEVVAFPVPHERFGQAPHVIVVVKNESDVTEDQIIQVCINEIGSYKKPASVEIRTESLPRTPVGKVSRKMIRAPYWEDAGRTN